MKKLVTKIQKLEARAKRKLLVKQAQDHLRQATKFREDAMKVGCELMLAGDHPFKEGHPVYIDQIRPLLEQAAKIAAKYGFNTLYQTHTPMEGHPHFTSAIGNINPDFVTPTMRGCIELIEKQPSIGKKKVPILPEDTGVHCTGHVDYNRPPEADPKASE